MASSSARVELALSNLGLSNHQAKLKENGLTDDVVEGLLWMEEEGGGIRGHLHNVFKKLITPLTLSDGMKILVEFQKVTQLLQVGANQGDGQNDGQMSSEEQILELPSEPPDQESGTSSRAEAIT